MQLSLKEQNMTITMDLTPEGDNDITAEDVLIAAYDAISRVFSQEAVIRAYHRTDPDTMALREDIVKSRLAFSYKVCALRLQMLQTPSSVCRIPTYSGRE